MAQKNSQYKKFGKLTQADFQPTEMDDLGYDAVLLQYSKNMYFDITDVGLKLFNKYHIRMRVLKDGFQDPDFFTIHFSGRFKYEQIFEHSCSVFSLASNGKIKESRVKMSSFKTYQKDSIESWQVVSLPYLKRGDVVDWEYAVAGFDFIMPDLCKFNHKYPCLKNLLVADFPYFLTYRYDFCGSDTLSISRISNDDFVYLKDGYRFNGQCDSFKVAPTVPAEMLPENERSELYGSTTIRMKANKVIRYPSALYSGNGRPQWDRLTFNLFSYTNPDNRYLSPNELRTSNNPVGYIIHESDNWKRLHKRLYKGYNFWRPIMKYHDFDPALIDVINADEETDTSKIINEIYKYMASNYKWNQQYCNHMQYGFKSISKTRQGNSAEINMLLVAYLRRYGLDAFPVLAATKGFCEVDVTYASTVQFNTVLAGIRLDMQTGDDSQVFLLMDATQGPDHQILDIGSVKNGELAMAVISNGLFFVQYLGDGGNLYNAKNIGNSYGF